MLTKEATRFYAGGLLLALIHMAEHGIMHRDLKPNNIVIGRDGYPKVIDFGLAKVGKDNYFCGTYEYMAPEILLPRCFYGRAVDMWAFGIIIYQLLAGYTPFKHMEVDDSKVLANIRAGKFTFPATNFDEASKSVITSLLVSVPEWRLGMGHRGCEEVMEHPFFDGFDFNQLEKCAMAAPWLPKLARPTDTKYFHPPQKPDLVLDPNYKDSNGWDSDWDT
jgi:serine/threonine protein kinase